MTGRALKALIFRWLEARGWRNVAPGKTYAWQPYITPKRRYTWQAALLLEMALEEPCAELHSDDSVGVAYVIDGERSAV